MIVLAGADVVLPSEVLQRATVMISGDRIAAVEARIIDGPAGATRLDVSGCTIVPGFVDVHVHGVEGHDVLDGPDAVAEIAARLPRYGVTAFCPTSVACSPHRLSRMLEAVTAAQRVPSSTSARVLPAHLESNFINPEYKGAQPAACLRTVAPRTRALSGEAFAGADILETIEQHRAAVAIVTLAPEIEGGLDLVSRLSAAGHIVSIGHSGATYEEARAAIAAGVSHATHLFNRMSPLSHRSPGVVGAVLESSEVTAELICDGWHVHAAALRLAIRMKGLDRIVAITDGTAGSGLPVGSRARLGEQTIVVTERTAELEDGTLAGSVLTMDGAFRTLVRQVGLTLPDAARLCATVPARRLGLSSTGRIEEGLLADLAVLDTDLQVRETFIGGARWRNPASAELV